MLNKVAVILVVASVTALAACGQKAPLYVPGVPKDAPWPYPDPPRKLSPTERKVPDLPGTSDERK